MQPTINVETIDIAPENCVNAIVHELQLPEELEQLLIHIRETCNAWMVGQMQAAVECYTLAEALNATETFLASIADGDRPTKGILRAFDAFCAAAHAAQN